MKPKIFTLMALMLIRIYQSLISPLLSPRCRFFPSCSAYGHESFRRFGFFVGMFLTARRLLKCHPFHDGGFDPVPTCKQKIQ